MANKQQQNIVYKSHNTLHTYQHLEKYFKNMEILD